MRILIAEDDALLGEGVEWGLRQAGFIVDWTKDGPDALIQLQTMDYELLVLDLGLPIVSGFEVLRQLRNTKKSIPVLILTARDTIDDRIAGLDGGADDYLVKPFALGELIARVRALLRRAHGRSESLITYRDIAIDPVANLVKLRGEPVVLAPKEYLLLVYLLEHRGVAMRRERLEQQLYSHQEEISSNTVEVHIHHLRRKFGDQLIYTVRNVGYLVRKEEP
jgi:two-component system, OmpR family, response regulator QseB